MAYLLPQKGVIKTLQHSKLDRDPLAQHQSLSSLVAQGQTLVSQDDLSSREGRLLFLKIRRALVLQGETLISQDELSSCEGRPCLSRRALVS